MTQHPESATPAGVVTVATGVAAHIGRYSDAVRIPAGHDLVVTSGTPGLDAAGKLPPDFTDEARQAWANVETALRRAGATLDDVVSVRQWLTSTDLIPAYAAVRAEVIRRRPSFMLGVVDALVWPDIRVEIEVVAAIPHDRQSAA